MQAHSHSTVGNHCGLLVVSHFNSSPWSPLLSTCEWSSGLNQFLPNNSALSIQRYTGRYEAPFSRQYRIQTEWSHRYRNTCVSLESQPFSFETSFVDRARPPDDIYVVAEICRSCLTACSVKVRRCKISEFSTKWLSFQYLKNSRCV